MQREIARKLMFNDGYVYNANLILLASQLRAFANDDDSRISQIINGVWKYRDFELDAILSVAALESEQQGFFMGRNGNILVAATSYTSEKIDDVPKYGELTRIRNISDQIYVVGSKGQVYRRENSGWIHVDRGLLGRESLHLEDIGGTGPSDLYVVGPYGDVWYFDGISWEKIAFPTNRPLAGVKAISEEEVFICGDNGNLFVGSKDNWRYIGHSDIVPNFWAVEHFKGKVYVSFSRGIFVYDGGGLTEVDFGVDRRVDCHRLHANDGMLWSFGIDDLFCFDGQKWTEVICPMNI
jgi:hypothetical protein